MISGNFKTFNLTPCLRKCLKMERSKIAKKCKKDSGYFKCCGTHWRLDPFENARNKLIDNKLIKDKKTRFCKRRRKKGNSRCHFCSMSGVCTKSDPFTGQLTNTFYEKKGKSSLMRIPPVVLIIVWNVKEILQKYTYIL